MATVVIRETADRQPRIAAFDLDWTLVRPRRGLFPQNEVVVMPRVREGLAYLRKEGYRLVVFTNQKRKSREVVEKYLDVVSAALGLPISYYASLEEDMYRKPDTGMWSLLPEPVDRENSFYVGDAAGRPGDFADTDRTFAENIGIPFIVPEEFFIPPSLPVLGGRHCVLLMGMPGVGKTTLYQKTYAPRGYIHINQDTLKTKALRTALSEGSPVVLDATYPGKEKRREQLGLAQNMGYQTDIIYLTRNGAEYNRLRKEPVPNIAYSMYFKYLELPEPGEVTGQIYEL